MEFTKGGRRDINRFYITKEEEEEEQEEPSKRLPPFLNPSSSSSSSLSTSLSTNPFRLHDGASGSGSGSGSGGGDNSFIEKEHMFDKVVTPSDVGKLNRLVIPKQYAEKYFPLDASANEKGLLLGFEDRTGKQWRFRYSYWNSSQSYVMTKGWSRFVKDKRLDAGDTVSFSRGVGETGRDRLFIDWIRRRENQDHPGLPRTPLPGVSLARSVGPWGVQLFVPPPVSIYDHNYQGYEYNATSPSTSSGQYLYFRSPVTTRPPLIAVQPGGSGSGLPKVLSSLPVIKHSQAATKRVRLFGVNLDCSDSAADADRTGNCLSETLPQFHPRSTLPLLQLPQAVVESSGASSSSSMNKEQQNSSSDLDL